MTRHLEKVLAADVDAALSDPATAAGIAAEAVKDIVATGEISAPAKIADSVRSRLAAKTNLMVAIETYAVRLKIVLRRNLEANGDGDGIFGRLTDAAQP